MDLVSDLTVKEFATVQLSVFMLAFCLLYVVSLAIRTWNPDLPLFYKALRVGGILALTVLQAYPGYLIIFEG